MLVRNLLGVLVAALLAAPAFAQFQQPQQQPLARPTISPYLNLLRNNGNNAPYLNYFGLVQPQQQAQQNANLLQQQITGLQNSAINNSFPGTGSELSTGKLPGYFTHRGYFLNSGGAGNFPTGVTGQISTAGNNSIFQAQNMPQINSPVYNPQSTIGSGNIMPFRR